MNQNQRREYQRKWKLANSDKVKAEKKNYRKTHGEIINAYHKKWRIKNPMKAKSIQRTAHLKRKYGLTMKEHDRLFNESNGCCNICNKPQSELNVKLSVDHNHITGKIRGLLCNNCNLGISLLQDDPNILLEAILYLKK